MRIVVFLLALLLPALAHAQQTSSSGQAERHAEDAHAILRIIADNYAYLDRFEGETVPTNALLQAEADAVSDDRSLLRYAERALLALADHHATTGSAFADSWALVPSFADLWIVERDGQYLVDAVREGSPAANAGIEEGAELLAIDEEPVREAVTSFWRDLGFQERNSEARAFAARVLAAGRRDRMRTLFFRTASGVRTLTLPNLYQQDRQDRPPITVTDTGTCLTIRFNNSLGDEATITAFDTAMEAAADGQRICLDLTDTPSGGNTVIARAVMGWFATEALPYQVHRLPSEERRTGIARQWVEQVLPRLGKHHSGPVSVRAGRWTGSMGEGLAIGLRGLGATLTGGEMAGLRGAIYDFTLPNSGLVIKLPAERLYTTEGTPREDVKVP